MCVKVTHGGTWEKYTVIASKLLSIHISSLNIIIIIIIIIMECKNKGDISNNRHDWDHFKVI